MEEHQQPSQKIEKSQKLDEIVPGFESLQLQESKGKNFRSNTNTFIAGGLTGILFIILGTVMYSDISNLNETTRKLLTDESIPLIERIEKVAEINKDRRSNIYNLLGPIIGGAVGFYFGSKQK